MIIFVIGLPALVVVICIAFVFFAVRHQDSTVRDDWYMDGKALYQDASKDKRAYDLGISGIMRFEQDNQVVFELNYPDAKAGKASYPPMLTAHISHATEQSKDRDFTLTYQSDNRYTGQVALDTSIAAKYYVQISPKFNPNTKPSTNSSSSPTTTQDNLDNQWRLIHAHKLPATAVLLTPLSAFAVQ